MKVPFEWRPTCSCGVKMKLIMYQGDYTSFKFWTCENCSIGNDSRKESELHKYKADYYR